MDLRDLWRGDLSLRRLRVLIMALPADSAYASTITQGWTLGHYLVADVFSALVHEPHPARPKADTEERALPPAIEAALAERAARKRQEQT